MLFIFNDMNNIQKKEKKTNRNNYIDCLLKVANMYKSKSNALKSDYKNAQELYISAAFFGSSIALVNLGIMYISGNGVKKISIFCRNCF